MMHGFGDSKNSLKETAELVEKIVKEQLIQFLNALSEVAVKINSKKIGIKEFLVLLRLATFSSTLSQVIQLIKVISV